MDAATAKLQGCTSFRLRRLARQVARRYDAEVAKVGLKTTQYSLLSHVLHLGPLKPGELALAMGVDASTLTRNIRPLVAAGYLKQSDGSDARSRRVTITDAGREKRIEAQRHWRHAQEQLNALLGPERVSALHKLIDDSIAILGIEDGNAGALDE